MGENVNLPLLSRLAWLGLFGIAMGLLEAIVVIYLRDLYFPIGFHFPLLFIPQRMLGMEVLREICTIAMLVAVSATGARTLVPRFSLFLFTFGVWDIFYYACLKILLGWPESLLTWDVLFLIPVTWTGPVLAPLICSITMIGLGLLFAYLHDRRKTFRITRLSWLLFAAGAAFIFLTFIWDYASIIMRGGFFRDVAGLAENNAYRTAVASYIPTTYHWGIFTAGEALVLAAGAIVYRKTTTGTTDSRIPY